jgi:hypothetical protein
MNPSVIVMGATSNCRINIKELEQKFQIEEKISQVFFVDIDIKEETKTEFKCDFNKKVDLLRLVKLFENKISYVIFDIHVLHFVSNHIFTFSYLQKLLIKGGRLVFQARIESNIGEAFGSKLDILKKESHSIKLETQDIKYTFSTNSKLDFISHGIKNNNFIIKRLQYPDEYSSMISIAAEYLVPLYLNDLVKELNLSNFYWIKDKTYPFSSILSNYIELVK